MSKLLMLDLGSGLGGASQAMINRGWDVVRVDIDSKFKPDIIADLREWSYNGPQPDLVWASPPCNEFSRESMPWCKTEIEPDLSIVLACKRIIEECQPRFWVIENVRGAIEWLRPILGTYRVIYGPFYLWGYFPDLGDFELTYKKKESYSSKAKEMRAMIPYQISRNLAIAVESQPELVFTSQNKSFTSQ